jgi:hypothetical protein
MRMSLKTLAITTSTVACAALLSFGWSPQGGVSLSVDKAQAYTRVVVRPYLHGPYSVLDGSLPWYAVRAYYAGGPWCSARGGVFGAGYGTAGWGLGNSYSCYSGWPDYRARNGIVCDPGTVIKGGDGILYECQ